MESSWSLLLLPVPLPLPSLGRREVWKGGGEVACKGVEEVVVLVMVLAARDRKRMCGVAEGNGEEWRLRGAC